MDKVEAWEQRGRRPLTVEEVQEVFNRVPFLPVPQELVILDGVVQTGPRRMAVGATPVADRNRMILTPLSNEDTVIHESIHGMGLGEVAAYGMTPMLTARSRFNMGIRRRDVKFQSGGTMPGSELQERFRLVSPELLNEIQVFYRMQQTRSLPSEIKIYRLTT